MITFSDIIPPHKGGSMFKINADRKAGTPHASPVGQIYWFKGHTATVHAKTLAGDYFAFEGGNLELRIERAKAFIERKAGQS